MRDNFSATEKALNQMSGFFDERVGKEVLEILDSLYAKGYRPRQIADALIAFLAEDRKERG